MRPMPIRVCAFVLMFLLPWPSLTTLAPVLVPIWAKDLVVDTSGVMPHAVAANIREAVQGLTPACSTHVTGLHLRRDSDARVFTAVSKITVLTPQAVRQALAVHEEVVHATIERHREAAA